MVVNSNSRFRANSWRTRSQAVRRPIRAVGNAAIAAIWMVVKKLFQAEPDQTRPWSPWTMPNAAS